MRWGVLFGCAAMACSFQSEQSPGESSEAGTRGATSQTSGASTDVTTDADAAGMVTSGGGSDPTGAGPSDTEDPSVDPSEGLSSTSTGDEAEAESSSGGDASPLSDEGLVARYYLDEAPIGTNPTHALDAAEDPVDLPLDYSSGAMHYIEEFMHRGLAFDVSGSDDAARRDVADTKFEGMDGVTQLTLEAVVRLDSAQGGSGSKIFHVGRDHNSDVGLFAVGADEIRFSWNTATVREWDYSAFGGAARVLHLVIDTTAANQATQFRLLVDGVELDPMIASTIEPSEPVMLDAEAIISLGNSHQDRTFQGVLFYFALYGVAVTDDVIAQHVSALKMSDDTPK